jgi:hypothetical protein
MYANVRRAVQGFARFFSRKGIIASGKPLLSWAEVEREVVERRGEADQRG